MNFKHSILIFVLAFCTSQNLNAQGDLFLTPRRIIFEAGKTSESVNLANTGKDTAQYSISFIHYRMKTDGSFVEIAKEEAGSLSAEPYLRYYPRTVTLAPGESQVIKVQYTKSPKFSNGELRSHLYFRATPKPKPLGLETKDKSQNIGVNLVPIFGLSIPVIIREGQTNVEVNLSNLKLVSNADSTTNTLTLNINRTGNISCYGDITLIHVDPQGNKHEVGIVKGIAVYYPNIFRTVNIPMIADKDIQNHKGKLIIQYNARHGVDGADGVVTETILDL